MQQNLSLKGLRIFATAIRLGSFQKAAEELRLTPSAISHQIRALEEELGRPLFSRGPRRIAPTADALSFHADIREALQIIDEATARLAERTRRVVLVVHSTPSFAFQTLMPHLPDFVIAHPEIDLRFSASQAPADQMRGQVDIDIRYSRHPPRSEGLVDILEETISPLVSPALNNRLGPIRTAADLLRFPRIQSAFCLVQWLDWQGPAGVAFSDEPAVRFDRSFMSIAAACDGVGVALESDLLAAGELRSGSLIAPLSGTGIRIAGHRIVARPPRAESPEVRSFLAFIRSVLPAATTAI